MNRAAKCLILATALAFAGCESSGSGGASQTGGATSTGGQKQAGGSGGGSGGAAGSGGTTSTGGSKSSGGSSGSGGSSATGGKSGSGGSNRTGGTTGSGGTAGDATGGARATGGSGSGRGGRTGTATGGTNATGGSGTGAGGSTGTGVGGNTGVGGSTASGGSTGEGGADAGADAAADAGADAGGTGDAVPSAGCGKTRTLQDGNRTISSGGQNRQYYLKTPSNYDNKHPYRLIFTFHWFYGSINSVVNPPDADHNTDRPFYGLSDLSGDTTIFVAPQGLSDTGGAGWANPNNRDVNFTDDMLKAISDDLCIDTSRVFTTGFSYGAAMSYKLACVRPDVFRAALVYEPGPVSGNNAAECTTPIAFFESHGVDDQVFNYQTGLSVLNIFVNVNGCTAMTPPDPPQNGHTCVSYEGCSRPTRFCNFGSGENNPYNTDLRGHYPSPKDPGETTSWVPAEAWEFITQF